jgi:protein dithiol:quinone oxidoreductase
MRNRAPIAFAAVLAGSLGAVAIALVHQHAFDMLPCAWCVFQRLIFLLMAALSALALALRAPGIRAALAAAIVLLGAGGIAAAHYQHVVAADTASCRLSLAQRIIEGALHLDTLLPSVFQVQVGCAAGATTLLGAPYEFWSLAAFAGLALIAAAAMRRTRIPDVS